MFGETFSLVWFFLGIMAGAIGAFIILYLMACFEKIGFKLAAEEEAEEEIQAYADGWGKAPESVEFEWDEEAMDRFIRIANSQRSEARR